ncbi:hypothetical protein BJX65DRAFT_311331 [Aspergillus insuetus]
MAITMAESYPSSPSGVANFNDTKEGVIKLLIDRCDSSEKHPPALQICLMFDAGIVRLLVDQCNGLNITPSIARAITGNRVSLKDVMASVLLHPHTPKLRDEMIYIICQSFDADVIRVLLSQQGGGVELTMDLAVSAYANRHRNKVMMAILQKLSAGYIAQDVIAMICERFDPVVVTVFLEKQNSLKVTAELINASSAIQEYGRAVIISILGQFGHPPIKPELVAMLCGLFGAGVLDRVENVAIPEAVVHAASRNFMAVKTSWHSSRGRAAVCPRQSQRCTSSGTKWR